MLARLSTQIAPGGVLLLVLPLRCINSKHVGGEARFEALLQGLGLREALPKRTTPRLIFYILARAEEEEVAGAAHLCAQSGEEAWRDVVRAATAAHMSSSALKQFGRDYSEVPPTEFSLSLTADLLPSAATNVKKCK